MVLFYLFCVEVGACTGAYLVGVQLALVHRVGVFNDFYLVLSKSFPVEALTENGAEQGLVSPGLARWRDNEGAVYLQPVRDLSQLCDGRFFVNKLLLVQVSKL